MVFNRRKMEDRRHAAAEKKAAARGALDSQVRPSVHRRYSRRELPARVDLQWLDRHPTLQ